MKKHLFYITFLIALVSCDMSVEENQTPLDGDNKNGQGVSNQFIIDSLSIIKNDLEIEIEVLKNNFDFKHQNFDGKSYYHKNWTGQYYIADQAVLAGVDSVGNFFLIANVWTYSYLNTSLDSIQIKIDTTNYFTHYDSSFSFINPIEVMCACGFHQAYFTNTDAQNIGREISQNSDKEIIWVGIKTLTKRDKVGIKESFDLSEKLQQFFDIENKIEQTSSAINNNTTE